MCRTEKTEMPIWKICYSRHSHSKCKLPFFGTFVSAVNNRHATHFTVMIVKTSIRMPSRMCVMWHVMLWSWTEGKRWNLRLTAIRIHLPRIINFYTTSHTSLTRKWERVSTYTAWWYDDVLDLNYLDFT